MVREGEGSAASVLTHDRGDGEPGQLDPRVCPCDGGIVPVLDLSQENAGIGRSGELQVALDAREVVGQHDASRGDGKQERAPVDQCHICVAHGCIACAEIDAFFLLRVPADKAANSLSASDRLIGDDRVRMVVLIRGKPLLVKDERERWPRRPARPWCPPPSRPAACFLLARNRPRAPRRSTRASSQRAGSRDFGASCMTSHGPLPRQLNSPLIYSLVCFSFGSLKICCDSPNSTR